MGSVDHQNYLDRETGAILFGASPDIEFELEQIEDELSSKESPTYEKLVEYIKQREMQDWLKTEILQAVQIENDLGICYIAIPWVESHEGYRDMELLIDTVEDSHVQQLLFVAIDGQGAFRRFKDVLRDHLAERERWFTFEREETQRRVLAWPDNKKIEVIE